MSINNNSISISSVHGVDYRHINDGISNSEAINLLKENDDSTEKCATLKNIEIFLFHIKKFEQILDLIDKETKNVILIIMIHHLV